MAFNFIIYGTGYSVWKEIFFCILNEFCLYIRKQKMIYAFSHSQIVFLNGKNIDGQDLRDTVRVTLKYREFP